MQMLTEISWFRHHRYENELKQHIDARAWRPAEDTFFKARLNAPCRTQSRWETCLIHGTHKFNWLDAINKKHAEIRKSGSVSPFQKPLPLIVLKLWWITSKSLLLSHAPLGSTCSVGLAMVMAMPSRRRNVRAIGQYRHQTKLFSVTLCFKRTNNIWEL